MLTIPEQAESLSTYEYFPIKGQVDSSRFTAENKQ